MRLIVLAILLPGLLLTPFAGLGQQAGKVYRIGHVAPTDFDQPERIDQRGWPAFELPAVFAEMCKEREQILDLAVKYRLPTIVDGVRWVKLGALIGYGPKPDDLLRQAATHVDRILRGAKPAGLPIGQPTTFELICNLKTAKALGVTIPKSILTLADQVVE